MTHDELLKQASQHRAAAESRMRDYDVAIGNGDRGRATRIWLEAQGLLKRAENFDKQARESSTAGLAKSKRRVVR